MSYPGPDGGLPVAQPVHLTIPVGIELADAGTVPQGRPFVASGSVSYPGAADDLAATVDYGDGSPTQTLAIAADKTFSLSHVYRRVGSSSILVTVTANDNAEGSAVAKVAVTYSWSGFLQPVNADNTSVFKLGSTVPIKFALTVGSAGETEALAKLYVAEVSNSVIGSEVEAVSATAASTGNLFRYDSTAGQYIYNWGTRGLTAGTYQLRVDLGDGVSRTVLASLK